MATHQSAIKRAKQNKKRRARNAHVRSTVATHIKKVRLAIEKKDVDRAEKALAKAIPLIQRAHSKGVFHKNTAARKISRLTRQVNLLRAQINRPSGQPETSPGNASLAPGARGAA